MPSLCIAISLRNSLFFILIVSLLLFSAVAANQEEIALRFAVWETSFQLSVYWWLLIAFGLGISTGLVNALIVNTRLRFENKRLRKQLENHLAPNNQV